MRFFKTILFFDLGAIFADWRNFDNLLKKVFDFESKFSFAGRNVLTKISLNNPDRELYTLYRKILR